MDPSELLIILLLEINKNVGTENSVKKFISVYAENQWTFEYKYLIYYYDCIKHSISSELLVKLIFHAIKNSDKSFVEFIKADTEILKKHHINILDFYI